MSFASRLYAGEVAYNFTGNRKRWYSISAVILVVSLAALLIRGLNLGIDFRGGGTYEFPRNGHPVTLANSSAKSAGEGEAVVQGVGSDKVRITVPIEDSMLQAKIVAAIAKDYGIADKDISTSTVGPTWGSQISKKALEGLGAFLILVVIFLALRFEPKMAAAAIVALLHDMLITVGVYALVGFEVTPSTVIAFLTILGFSLYDTVVVFDRVRELTAGLQSNAKRTYSQAANTALNQTLIRSINTSFIALVPVAALLIVGAGLLGASTLEDLALAQLVGLAAGAYSSIFIATPLLAQLKEREPGMVALAAKVARAEASGKPVGGAVGRRPATAAGSTTRGVTVGGVNAGGAVPQPGIDAEDDGVLADGAPDLTAESFGSVDAESAAGHGAAGTVDAAGPAGSIRPLTAAEKAAARAAARRGQGAGQQQRRKGSRPSGKRR